MKRIKTRQIIKDAGDHIESGASSLAAESIEEARATGAPFYWGALCPRGHGRLTQSVRYISNSQCVSCNKLSKKRADSMKRNGGMDNHAAIDDLAFNAAQSASMREVWDE